MKCLALPLLALVAFQQTAAPQAGTLLRRTLKADTSDTYLIVDQSEQSIKSPLGEAPVTISTTRSFKLKTKTVDEKTGVAVIEATTSVDKVQGDGVATDLVKSKPAPVTQTGKIDTRGRITFERKPAAELVGGLLSGGSSTLAAGSFIEFPEKAVKVGDTWPITVPKDPLIFGEDQKLTATLTGEKDLDGVAVWVISVRGTLRSAIDSRQIPGSKPINTKIGPMSVRITGTDSITAEGLVEKSSGRTLSMTSKTVSKKTTELVEAGISMDSSGTSESKITLKKPGE